MINFNGTLIEEDKLSFSDLYRLAFFGDGLFESIYADDKHIYFAKEHFNRIKKGLDNLKISNRHFDFDTFITELYKLTINQAYNYSRIKLLVWRKGRGTYTPESNEMNFMILIEEAEEFSISKMESVTFDNSYIPMNISKLSSKTSNALPYVLASHWKKESSSEEIILVKDDIILEASASNIILIKDQSAITNNSNPFIVTGIMQDFLFNQLRINDFRIRFGDMDMNLYKESDCVLFTNSFGIRYLDKGSGLPDILTNKNDFIELFPKLPLQP